MKKISCIILSGSASEKLAKDLAKELGIPFVRTERTQFVNSEVRLRIETPVRGKHCVVVQSTGNSVHDTFFELFLLVDIVKKGGARAITAVIPYLGYSRQHKKFRTGESESLEVALRTLKMLGVGRIVTVDFHNPESMRKSPVPMENVSALPLLTKKVQSEIDPKQPWSFLPTRGHRACCFFRHSFRGTGRFTFVRKERHLHRAHHIVSRYA